LSCRFATAKHGFSLISHHSRRFVSGRCLTVLMTTAPLSFIPGHRLGRGSVLEDLAMIEAGVDQGLLIRAEVLLEGVEENEIPPEPDRFGPGPSTIPVPVGELRAGPDDLGARVTSRDEDGILPSRPVTIAGEGAPMVSDLGLVDLAATDRKSTRL